MKRGEIWRADLDPVVGSEQGGIRPVVILQNDVGNRYSPTVIVAAVTSRRGKSRLPVHVDITGAECGLPKNSIVLLEQLRTLEKRRLSHRMGRLTEETMARVEAALALSLGTAERRAEDVQGTQEKPQ